MSCGCGYTITTTKQQIINSPHHLGVIPYATRGLLMNNLPDSLPYQIKVSFFEHKRKEWEKVLQSSQTNPTSANQPDFMQHWEVINRYALTKIQEIDGQLAELKMAYSTDLVAPSKPTGLATV
jgi:hypothetical protein